MPNPGKDTGRSSVLFVIHRTCWLGCTRVVAACRLPLICGSSFDVFRCKIVSAQRLGSEKDRDTCKTNVYMSLITRLLGDIVSIHAVDPLTLPMNASIFGNLVCEHLPLSNNTSVAISVNKVLTAGSDPG